MATHDYGLEPGDTNIFNPQHFSRRFRLKAESAFYREQKSKNEEKAKKTVSEEKYNPNVVSLYAYSNNETN